MKEIEEKSLNLLALGARGIRTEDIEAILAEISATQDQVALGDQVIWERLEELRLFWGNKLLNLQAYLAC